MNFDPAAAAAFPHRLNRIYIPSFPGVVRRYALPFDVVTVFRGVEVVHVDGEGARLGRPRSYIAHDLVEAYWRIYDWVAP